MKTLIIAALALLVSSPAVHASGKSASSTFQATFVVNEACTVQSAGATRPVVSCQFASPSHVTQAANPVNNQAADSTPVRSVSAPAAGVWVVTF